MTFHDSFPIAVDRRPQPALAIWKMLTQNHQLLIDDQLKQTCVLISFIATTVVYGQSTIKNTMLHNSLDIQGVHSDSHSYSI